jgi:hypothetical protein
MAMWSIGGKILDVYDDVGLKQLAASPYFEKVGSLQMGDPDKLSGVDDRSFGVVFITKKGEFVRKFPLNDSTNIALSNVYFEMNHAKLPPEAKVAAATQINQASKLAGYKPLPAVEKYAAAESVEGSHYIRLAKISGDAGQSIDFFKQLHDEYVEKRSNYSREDKVALAQAMAPAADKYGFEVHEDLKPFLIKDPAIDKEALFAQIALRKELTKQAQEAGPLLNDLLKKQADFEPKEMVRLLETFDRQFELYPRWTRDLEPNLVLMEKEAYHSIPIRGGLSMSFSDSELKSWVAGNDELLQKMFGKELAEKIKGDPAGQIWCLPSASRDFIGARIENARDNSPAAAK